MKASGVDRRAGKVLRTHRAVAGMTQDDVADVMRRSGHRTWSRATVSEIERGGRSVALGEVWSLAVIFRTTVQAFADGQVVAQTSDRPVGTDFAALLSPVSSAVPIGDDGWGDELERLRQALADEPVEKSR